MNIRPGPQRVQLLVADRRNFVPGLWSAFYPRQRILGYPTLRLYPTAKRPHRGETVVPRRRRSVTPAVLEDPAHPLGVELVEDQVGAEVPDHRPQGVGVAATPVSRQRFGRQELLDSSAEGGDTMRKSQDFAHLISLYQRYPTGFTELQATHSPSLFVV